MANIQPHGNIDQDKRDAFVLSFFETGNVRNAAQLAGVSDVTGYKWYKEEWFKKAMRQLDNVQNKGMDGRITQILDKCFLHLNKRLDEGDEKVFQTKEGPVRMNVPIPGKDLAVIAGVLFDKRNQLRKEQDPDDSSAESALDRIADKLRQYSVTEKLRGKSEVVDVEANEPGEDLC